MDKKWLAISGFISIVLIIGHTIPYLNNFFIFEGYMRMKNNAFLGLLLLFAVIIAESQSGYLKYYSQVVLASNMSNSVSGNDKTDIVAAGDWKGIRLGGITLGPMKGRDGTLFAPKLAIKKKEGGYKVAGRAKKVEKKGLPKILKELVDEENLPEPYHIVYAPDFIEENNVAYVKSFEVFKDLNSLLNDKDDAVEDLQDYIEDMNSFKNRIKKNRNFGRIVRKVEGGSEED